MIVAKLLCLREVVRLSFLIVPFVLTLLPHSPRPHSKVLLPLWSSESSSLPSPTPPRSSSVLPVRRPLSNRGSSHPPNSLFLQFAPVLS